MKTVVQVLPFSVENVIFSSFHLISVIKSTGLELGLLLPKPRQYWKFNFLFQKKFWWEIFNLPLSSKHAATGVLVKPLVVLGFS